MKHPAERPVYLGSLGVMEYFTTKKRKGTYRTITYPPSNTCPTYGTRWCLNMTTLKAEYFLCRVRVFHVERNN
jgi:hypothetical protein